ncbi:hypothetical protein [Pseudothauera rhizosphaerae]|uniref:Uncharacterized protein n=1 Tax=Pseudothauera rhizosphaerae TaxID=2565932 RepID=A0A4S4AXP3_9RHOO|nr:hypothetical protein [Pseudothauera rhizosphaerae]THF63372.1 hypothetical protein E6O51_04725 [Pseudothauera rhizosphaerae]
MSARYDEVERLRAENRALHARIARLEEALQRSAEDIGVLRAGHRLLQRSMGILLSGPAARAAARTPSPAWTEISMPAAGYAAGAAVRAHRDLRCQGN